MNKSIHIVFFTLIVFIVNGLIHNTNAQQRPLKKRPVKVGRSMKNNGQDSIERKYIISCYPVNFIATTIKVGYEFKLSPHKGFKFIAAFGNADATGNVTDSNTFYNVLSFTEFSLEGQFRFYVSKDRPTFNGLYLAPYMFYKTMNYTAAIQKSPYNVNDTYRAKGNVSDFGIGYIIGYQYILTSRVCIDGFLGAGENVISGDNTPGSLHDIFAYPKGIMVHMGLGLGYAF